MRRGLLERGHAVQLLAPAYRDLTDDDPGIHRAPSVPCPPYPAVRISWPWGAGLRAAMRRFDPHVVHAVTEGPVDGLGRAYARRRGLPLVTSFHTDFPRYAGKYLGGWAVSLTRRYLRWFHGPARATQTPSDVTRDELRALGLPRAVTWGRGIAGSSPRPAGTSAAASPWARAASCSCCTWGGSPSRRAWTRSSPRSGRSTPRWVGGPPSASPGTGPRASGCGGSCRSPATSDSSTAPCWRISTRTRICSSSRRPPRPAASSRSRRWPRGSRSSAPPRAARATTRATASPAA